MEYACYGSLQNSSQSRIRACPETCEAAFWKLWARVSGATRYVNILFAHTTLAHTNNYNICVCVT